MRGLPEDAPVLPAWMALVAPAVAWVAVVPATLIVALVLGLAGVETDSPGALLAGAVAAVAAAGGGLALMLRQTAGVTAAGLGLRGVAPRVLLAALVAGVAVVALLGVVLALPLRAFAFPDIPAALSQVDPIQRGDTDVTRVTFGAPVAALLLALVLVAGFGEVILRGVVLPALARATSVPAAVLIVAGVSALLAFAGGSVGPIVLALVALNLLNAWLYLDTGSVLPGVAIASGAGGALLVAGLQWSPAACALTGLACALLGLALAGAAARLLGPNRGWALRSREVGS